MTNSCKHPVSKSCYTQSQNSSQKIMHVVGINFVGEVGFRKANCRKFENRKNYF